jgi:hypothetical protein
VFKSSLAECASHNVADSGPLHGQGDFLLFFRKRAIRYKKRKIMIGLANSVGRKEKRRTSSLRAEAYLLRC